MESKPEGNSHGLFDACRSQRESTSIGININQSRPPTYKPEVLLQHQPTGTLKQGTQEVHQEIMKEHAVSYFEVLFWDFPEGTSEYNKNSQYWSPGL
jgi:hypothetical protein